MQIEIPIVEVTLMEDRARVVRRATVDLPAGLTRLVVDAVAPVLSDKTLAARSASARVSDVSIERRRLHERSDKSDEAQRLEKAVEASADLLRTHRHRLSRIEESLGLLDEAADRTLEELAVDAAWGRADKDGWQRRLGSVAELDARLREERLAVGWDLAETQRELSVHEKALVAASTPSREMHAAITVAVEVEEAGQHPVEIEYVVPNACWRPQHRASLDGNTLRFECRGCVWQNTGEDWPDVQLRFSTQRPSLGAEPPTLETDRLSVKRKADKIVVEQRQQVIETTGLGQAAAASAPELPGIDDGGEVQELLASHRISVVSDGSPHHAALFEIESEARESLFCVPELDTTVLRKTEQTNRATRPILAGPVDLLRSGGFVGRTTILYVAPEEQFELGWGPDPSLRVHRETDETEEESKLLSSWYRSERKVVDKLSNLGPDTKLVELVERVPVSEIEKVKIEVDQKKTGRDADTDGFVRWDVRLEPFGRERIELRYVVNRHSDVSGNF